EDRRSRFSKVLPFDGQVDPDILARLARTWCCREAAAAAGFHWIRRARDDGVDYFLVNAGESRFDGWLELHARARQALLLNPLDGAFGRAAFLRGNGAARVYLQIETGQSMIVRTYSGSAPHERQWSYVKVVDPGAPITGPWRIEFLSGGPELPAPASMDSPASW